MKSKEDSLVYKLVYKSPTPVLRILFAVFFLYIMVPIVGLFTLIFVIVEEICSGIKDTFVHLKEALESEFRHLRKSLKMRKSIWKAIWKGERSNE